MRQRIRILCVAGLFAVFTVASSAEQQAGPSVETLVKQLEDSTDNIRVEAAKALGKLGLPATAAVDELVKLLSDPNPNVRGAAAQALGSIGPPAKRAAPALLKLFKDVDSTDEFQPIWSIAATAYGKIDTESLPLLIEHLKSDDRLMIYASATAIHHMGPAAKSAVPQLAESLRKNDEQTRIAFIYTLMGIGPGAESALAELVQMMHNEDFHTRYWACRAVGKIGLPGAKAAVPELLKLLGDEVASVRGNAAAALGNLGPKVGPEVVPALTKAMNDKLYNVRSSAVIALGQMGPLAISALPQLDANLTNKSFAAGSQAAIARWRITGEIEPTVRVLLAELENPDSPWEAARGFEQIGPPASVAVDRLIKILNSKDRESRVWTMSALAAIGASSKPALPKLNELLKDNEEEIREVAAESIRMIENAEK